MPGEFTDWRRRNTVFQDVAAMRFWVCNLTGASEAAKIFGAKVTAGLFPMLQVQPELGRLFLSEEEQPGHDGVVILSDGLWKRAFAGDPQILGRNIQIDGTRPRGNWRHATRFRIAAARPEDSRSNRNVGASGREHVVLGEARQPQSDGPWPPEDRCVAGTRRAPA